jgi:thiosulfate/3-mercaptopyruvate sulfurtransferase
MHDPRKALVDNRPRREYLGMEFKDGATRPGHIPGAVGLHWKEDLVPAGPAKGYWQSLVEIKHMYAARGVTADKDIYLYAHNGLPATHSLVALYLAGFPLERLHLYEGSWVEWSRSQEAAELGDPTPAPPVKTGKPEKFSKRGSREKKEKP